MTPTPGFLAQMVRDIDDKHEEGHARLRGDLRLMDSRVTAIESAHHNTLVRLAQMEVRPTDVTQLHFTPRVVFAVVVVCVSVAAAQWGLNAGLRNDVLKAMADQRSEIRLLQMDVADLKEKLAALRR